jgi:hypothetical protein
MYADDNEYTVIALIPSLAARETSLAAKAIEIHKAVRQTAVALPKSNPKGAVPAAAQYAA